MRRLSNPWRDSESGTAQKWRCQQCDEVMEFSLPRPKPEQCKNCGSDRRFIKCHVKE